MAVPAPLLLSCYFWWCQCPCLELSEYVLVVAVLIRSSLVTQKYHFSQQSKFLVVQMSNSNDDHWAIHCWFILLRDGGPTQQCADISQVGCEKKAGNLQVGFRLYHNVA